MTLVLLSTWKRNIISVFFFLYVLSKTTETSPLYFPSCSDFMLIQIRQPIDQQVGCVEKNVVTVGAIRYASILWLPICLKGISEKNYN